MVSMGVGSCRILIAQASPQFLPILASDGHLGQRMFAGTLGPFAGRFGLSGVFLGLRRFLLSLLGFFLGLFRASL